MYLVLPSFTEFYLVLPSLKRAKGFILAVKFNRLAAVDDFRSRSWRCATWIRFWRHPAVDVDGRDGSIRSVTSRPFLRLIGSFFSGFAAEKLGKTRSNSVESAPMPIWSSRTGWYRVLPSFTEFSSWKRRTKAYTYTSLTRISKLRLFYRVLPGFMCFYLGLSTSTEYYLVLPSFFVFELKTNQGLSTFFGKTIFTGIR